MTVPVVAAARADCGCGGSGGGCGPGEECLPSDFIDPDDCPECACGPESYLPYCISNDGTDPADVQAAVAAMTPFAYYPMTSGLGGTDVLNGHTATGSSGTVNYAATGITAKHVTGEATALTAGGSITFPPPRANLTNQALPWAAALVMQVDAYDSGAGGSGPFGFFNWAPAAGSPPKMAIHIDATGHLVSWTDSNFGSLGKFLGTTKAVFALGEPHVLVINAPTVPAGQNGLMIEFWLDGVLVLHGWSDDTGVGGDTFTIGRSADHFFGAIDLTFSNLVTFARGLSLTEIESLTSLLIDDAIIAAGEIYAP